MPSPMDGLLSGMNFYDSYFVPFQLDPLGLIDFDPIQIPRGEDEIKEAINRYGKEWGRKAYQWARKHDQELAQKIKRAEKFAKVKNIQKRTSGHIDKKLAKGIAKGMCQLACLISYRNCLNNEYEEFEQELSIVEYMIRTNQFDEADSRLDNAETAAYAGMAICATKYAICALGCMCPWS